MSKIGIIGAGILGQTQKRWLLDHTNNEVLVYDLDNGLSNSTFASVAKHADVFILCLPTPGNKIGELDTRIIEEAIKKINQDSTGHKIVVIRSTVPVGFTNQMASRYPNLYFYFVPEFLTEKTAAEDFNEGKKFIIGSKDDDVMSPEIAQILRLFPHPQKIISVKWEVAETLKLATNSFYAMKVIFANQLAQFCGIFDIDYNRLRYLLSINPRIGSCNEDNQGRDVHLRIAQDGEKGYGGKCLPKDTAQLATQMENVGIKNNLLSNVSEINKVIKSQYAKH